MQVGTPSVPGISGCSDDLPTRNPVADPDMPRGQVGVLDGHGRLAGDSNHDEVAVADVLAVLVS